MQKNRIVGFAISVIKDNVIANKLYGLASLKIRLQWIAKLF
jgi:hypothetical protein